jgi:Protein of unknown function (DUF664)
MRDLDTGELLDSLDANREVVVHKVDDLDIGQATAIATPTGVTLLGIVGHLAWVERAWFEHHFLGGAEGDADIDASFRVDPATTVERVVADYRAACDRSREIVAGASSLELPTREPHWFFGIVSLRWVLFHMSRETARHAGHMDILRELTDGRTGHF